MDVNDSPRYVYMGLSDPEVYQVWIAKTNFQ